MRAVIPGCVVVLCSVGAAQVNAVADCNQVRDSQLRLRGCQPLGWEVGREGEFQSRTDASRVSPDPEQPQRQNHRQD
jgi:hypothetical protein